MYLRLDPVHLEQALLVLGLDPGDDLDVLLEPRAAQLGGEQLVDLEDAGGVVHVDLDADRARLALDDADLVDRRRRQRVDVRQLRLHRHARAAVLHVERVGHAHDPGLERERPPAAAVADDRVHDLGGDDRPLGLLVDAGQQRVQLVGGEEQAERLVVDAVDRHAEVVQQAGAGDHHLGVVGVHRVVDLDRRLHAAPVQQPEQPQRAVEHDLQVHPRVVAHAEPLGGHLRGVPARLQLRVRVRGRQEARRAWGCARSARGCALRRPRRAERQRDLSSRCLAHRSDDRASGLAIVQARALASARCCGRSRTAGRAAAAALRVHAGRRAGRDRCDRASREHGRWR